MLIFSAMRTEDIILWFNGNWNGADMKTSLSNFKKRSVEDVSGPFGHYHNALLSGSRVFAAALIFT